MINCKIAKYHTPKTYLGKSIPRSGTFPNQGIAANFENLELFLGSNPPPILGNGLTNLAGLSEDFTTIFSKIIQFGGNVKVPITFNK